MQCENTNNNEQLPVQEKERAHSFRQLKSAKSSENGRLPREKISVTKRMGILKTVELADLTEKCQKNTHSENGRVGRDFAEKNTNRMVIIKE